MIVWSQFTFDNGEESIPESLFVRIWNQMEAEDKVKTVFFTGNIKTAEDFNELMGVSYPSLIFDERSKSIIFIAFFYYYKINII